MTVYTSAGSTLRVLAAAPATFDPTGYNALVMTLVGEITDLGEFGREYALVTFTRIARDRCIAVRRPAYRKAPATAKPVQLAANGALSTNEA